jgi:UDP-N-acetylglucosamine--N-acetylmuramyl-(pentapeptide) pyrophosphoryl-undecaprenol N-acetylglucosamine transferase
MNLQNRELRIIISGGGTGGHIFPAVSIAQALQRLHPQCELLFVGANGRMEMEKVPAAGYKIVGLDIAGFQRRLAFSNLLLPFKIIKSLFEAQKIIRDFKPDAVVGVGGYASGPLLFAASMMGIPSLIQEQNSFAGVTNRILSKRAKKICVAYEGMEKYFPSSKIIMTGNPVREDLSDLEGKKNEALKYFQLDANKPVLLVIGGSLGARTINQAIGNGLKEFINNDVQLIWQTGKSGYATAQELVNTLGHPYIKVYDFISKMDFAYASATAVVSRAGASSVSELAIAGKASILVPSPNVAEDHQTKNAMALTKRDAAILVSDKDAGNQLVKEALSLISSNEKISLLQHSIAKMALRGASTIIAREVCRLAEGE